MTAKQISLWEQLRSRLIVVTRRKGSKADLARHLEVKPASVSQYLSGRISPTAETTLRLLAWVKAEEGKQQKTPGSASNTTKGRKTRKPLHANEESNRVRSKK
jgi:transcriptional regulator with XRE-family HTH domain